MIVPAVTLWPLKRFTPSRWLFESRPLREEAAPFFFDTSLLALRDRGDLDRRVVLAVTPPLALVRLVLVREALDLRSLGLADDPSGHRRATQLARRGQHLVAVDEQHRLQ